MNRRTLNGLPLARSFRTSRVAFPVLTTGASSDLVAAQRPAQRQAPDAAGGRLLHARIEGIVAGRGESVQVALRKRGKQQRRPKLAWHLTSSLARFSEPAPGFLRDRLHGGFKRRRAAVLEKSVGIESHFRCQRLRQIDAALRSVKRNGAQQAD